MDPRALDSQDLVAKTRALRRLARALVGDEHQAEDLAQETWVTALDHDPAPHPATSTATESAPPGTWFGRWLSGITKNHARQHRRTQRRRQRREEIAARQDVHIEEDTLEHLDLLEHLLDQVRRLEEPYRTAILLRFVEGLDSTAAGQKLGIPDATVRSQVKRGLAKLRARMDAATDDGRRGWLVPLTAMVGGSPVAQGLLVAKAVAVTILAITAAGGWWWVHAAPRGAASPARDVATQPSPAKETPGAAPQNRGMKSELFSPTRRPNRFQLAEKTRLQRIAKALKEAVKAGKLTEAEAKKKWQAVQKQKSAAGKRPSKTYPATKPRGKFES